MRLQFGQGHEFEGFDVGGGQHHGGRYAGVEGFFPAAGTQAPAVSGFQARKSVFGDRCDQVVAPLPRKRQKCRRHFGANHVAAVVVRVRVAAAIAVITGQWVIGAGHQWRSQHIQSVMAHGLDSERVLPESFIQRLGKWTNRV